MKKNKAMRLASTLLVLTLLTTCAVSSTFAKYATTTSGSDKARVAYWGFKENASTTIELFDSTYKNVKATTGSVDGYDKVIAPGTSGSAKFKFDYTNYKTDTIKAPEVAYTFKVESTVTGSYTQLDDNNNFKWTLAKGDATPTEYSTIAQLTAAIKELSGNASGSKIYAAGKLPDAFSNNETYTIGWKWDFDTAAKDSTNDAADTKLGNALDGANATTDLENVNITITITATQVDSTATVSE